MKRSTRPRDALGRPLAPDSLGVPRVPDDAHFTVAEGLAEAQRLLAAGYPFHAHEVLEAVWKATAGPERELWRGLAQLAVGLTHRARGNPAGAAALLRRAAARLEEFTTAPPHGIPVAELASWARGLADVVGGAADATGIALPKGWPGFGPLAGASGRSPTNASSG